MNQSPGANPGASEISNTVKRTWSAHRSKCMIDLVFEDPKFLEAHAREKFPPNSRGASHYEVDLSAEPSRAPPIQNLRRFDARWHVACGLSRCGGSLNLIPSWHRRLPCRLKTHRTYCRKNLRTSSTPKTRSSKH